MPTLKEVQVGNKTISFEFNKFARQANGSVLVSCGDTQVLVTVCAASEPKPGQDFFPLTVDYIEKYYAGGRIPGGFVKRETKPSEREALTSRVIDRPLRPSFPKGYMTETHVVATVLSVDYQTQPAVLALLGASAALMISDIPFNGPVAALRVGMKDGEFVLDPSEEETKDLDLNIAANPDAILMVEAGANFLPEAKIIEALKFAHEQMAPLFSMQLELQKEIGKEKRELALDAFDTELYGRIESLIKEKTLAAFSVKDKQERGKRLKQVSLELLEQLGDDTDESQALKYYDKLKYNLMRQSVVSDKKRIDGRGSTDIRQITCETSVLKRTHGSSLFTRGETQSLSTITLGSTDDEQRLDTLLTPGASKAFMLHYNFPPFSVGEARPLRAPGRREIGHGNLAETALQRVIPPRDKFNYSIRLVSEILESNGSSSMATVCAGTMALLDAGVPILQPVAGIAMGLIKEGDDHVVLSDILGDEDHLGDMDFKVTGGHEGITALQMDIKIGGLPWDIIVEALDQARSGIQHILGKMVSTIDTPNELSDYAPRIFQMKIKEDKVRDLIGPGGKTIRHITSKYGVKIEANSDNGMIAIVAPDNKTAEEVKKVVRSITADPIVGEISLGKVKRITDFGAFVEIKPGTEGLLHISQLDHDRVDRVEDILNLGDDVMIKIIDVDRQGKIKLSRKDALGKKPTVASNL